MCHQKTASLYLWSAFKRSVVIQFLFFQYSVNSTAYQAVSSKFSSQDLLSSLLRFSNKDVLRKQEKTSIRRRILCSLPAAYKSARLCCCKFGFDDRIHIFRKLWIKSIFKGLFRWLIACYRLWHWGWKAVRWCLRT